MAIIDKPSDFFNTKLYTGNGSTQSITGVGFQPDWTWVKKRNGAVSHQLIDVIRTPYKRLQSNENSAEAVDGSPYNYFKTFDNDGFTIGTGAEINGNSDTFASWNWKAGTSFTNDASSTGIGTIDSSGSASNTAGFSIVSYSGASGGGSIKHGLSVKPDIVLIKCRSATANWLFTTDIIDGSKDYLFLNQTNAKNNLTTALPTSSVFTVSGDDDQGENGKTYIAYCFNSVQSYSKFGSYTGNGNADGTFVYTGFKPAWVMVKRTDSANDWCLYDNKRDTDNVVQDKLQPNQASAESDDTSMDFVSNGFKFRETGGNFNASGGTYIYMAFAENPFVASNFVPTTAR
mgnify:CR=1 FL=1